MLSQTAGQVLYALLTRPPPSPEGSSRLACVKHSVSVHPEPGSNSSFNLYNSVKFTDCLHQFIVVFAFIVFLYSVANVLINHLFVTLSRGQDIYYHRFKKTSIVFLKNFYIFFLLSYILLFIYFKNIFSKITYVMKIIFYFISYKK